MRGLSWRNFDFLLFGAAVLASAFGAMMIRSAVAGNPELAGYDTRQIYFALVGALVIVILASIDYRYWLALHWPMYIVMMVFLMSLSGLGQAAFGAQRWFQVGVLFVQPTEFAKIIIILTLARYFEKSQHEPKDLKWLLRSLVWVWGLLLWILLQPNLSNVIVAMFIWVAMVWMNGVQVKQVALLGLAILLVLAGVLYAGMAALAHRRRCGAAPGAAAGFEIGLIILEWLGLAMLLQWAAESLWKVSAAFVRFIGTVWNARGNATALERAAREFAEGVALLLPAYAVTNIDTPPLTPSAPAGLAAIAGSGQVWLTWNPSPGATNYVVQKATSFTGPFAAMGTPIDTAWLDTGLTNGITYYYVVAANGLGGSSANSAPVAVTPAVPAPVVWFKADAVTGLADGAVPSASHPIMFHYRTLTEIRKDLPSEDRRWRPISCDGGINAPLAHYPTGGDLRLLEQRVDQQVGDHVEGAVEFGGRHDGHGDPRPGGQSRYIVSATDRCG